MSSRSWGWAPFLVGVLVLGEEYALAFLSWGMLALATSFAGGVLAWCGSSVFVFWAVGVSFLFGPGLPIFLVSFPLGPDLGPDGGAAFLLSWGYSLVV